jgi:hypothetical protein
MMNPVSDTAFLTYVYCVAALPPEAAADIVALPAGKLWAVTVHVSPETFGEAAFKKNLGDLAWVEQHVRHHEAIIERVMQKQVVVPFKFGTIFSSDDNAKKFLNDHAADIEMLLTALNGKEEWGVKLYCEPTAFKTHIARTDAEILRLDAAIQTATAGKSFFLSKKRNDLLDAILQQDLSQQGQIIFDRLATHSVQTRTNRLLPKAVTERTDEMILNAAFLVPKPSVTAFADACAEMQQTYADSGISVELTGPWPPYNFCNFEIKQEGLTNV